MPMFFGESWKPFERGYHAVYREREVNHCPGCGSNPVAGRTGFGRMRLLRDSLAAC